MAVTDKTEAAELAARAARVIPGGVNSGQRRVPGLEELVIAATSGSTFTDGDGNIYTDYHAAFGPPLLGHGDPDVDAAVAAAAREVGLMGVGVTRDRGRAGREDRRARAVGRAGAADRDRQRGDLPRAPRRARRDRPPAHRQVPGLLPRLARLGRDERDLAARERRQEGPAVEGDAPRGHSTRRSSAASTTPTRSSARSTDHDVAAIILEPIPHNIGAVLPQPGFLERLRELATKHGTVLIFDEVITGFRHALGGYQSIAGVTPDLTTLGKAMGNGWPDLGARRQGRADGAVLDDARPAGVLRRHVQRPPADGRRRARDDRQARARAGARARLRARRADARRACASCTRGSACRSSSAASARSSSPTSSTGR